MFFPRCDQIVVAVDFHVYLTGKYDFATGLEFREFLKGRGQAFQDEKQTRLSVAIMRQTTKPPERRQI